MNHKWNYQPITPEQAETSQTLAQELGISPILGQLLVQRGITKAGDAKKFFRPQLPDLHDPFLMNDMDIAVERLNKAMGKKGTSSQQGVKVRKKPEVSVDMTKIFQRG